MDSSRDLTSESLIQEEDDLEEETMELIPSEGIPLNADSGDVARAVTLVKTQNIFTGPTAAGTVGEATLDLQIDNAEEIFVETESFRTVKQKLKDLGHVTICGAAGEGKTTTALVLGSQYRQRGYKLAFVDRIEKLDLDSLLSSSPRVFLIIDDMFGTVGLSTDVSQLKTFLNKLDQHLKHCKRLQKQQAKKGVEHEIETSRGPVRKQQPTKDIRVVFTSKTYNFHDGLAKLQYEGFSLFKGPTLVDLTTQEKHRYTHAEKKAIFEHHRKIHKEYSDEECEDIPDFELWDTDSNMFGFPLICKLYFEFSIFHHNKMDFFKKPLSYLRLELKNMLETNSDRSAILVLMLLCDGKLNLAKLEADGKDQKLDNMVRTVLKLMPSASRLGMYKEAKCLRGTYFTRGDAIGFAHSSIYDAFACSLYDISPRFVLTHCSDNFIYERVQPQQVEETKIDDHLHLIYVSEQYYNILTTRLAESIRHGRFSKSVTHPILQHEKVSLQLLEKLQPDGSMDDCWFHKEDKGKCFLSWAVLGHSPRFVQEIEYRTGGEFTQTEISDSMEYCVINNNLTVLKWLLNRSENPDIDVMNRWLLLAARHRSSETLVYLIENGADVFTTDADKRNIIHLACMTEQEKTLKVLKEHSIKLFDDEKKKVVINSIDGEGRTPLMIAAIRGSHECYQLLQSISDKKTKDKNEDDIIHMACYGGNKAIVKHLLSPSNINTRDQEGWTPIMIAAHCGHQSVFDLLVSEEANLKVHDTNGDSLLHLACQGGNKAIVQHLVSPSNIDTRGQNRCTPVMAAAICGHQSVFDLLVTKDANLTLVDKFGHTLVHLACRGGNMAIVKHLVSPSNINTRGQNGCTPVMIAAAFGQQSVFDFLVANHADLKVTDNRGDTLLHAACQGGNKTIVQHLVSPSNINTRGQNEYTPIMIAAVFGHQNVFDFLISRNADLTHWIAIIIVHFILPDIPSRQQ